ncbi:transcriptional repressor TCF25-domain-containing protein [Filobasidium floriforme]|uniref:transcriptional repressor TCF25-domain-containing protein n=1 Tax=Filobasidium floriforme TaxID=5210 RepID=UPI001E8EB4D1|nr:transcriptional repressor TCF25-domain-containing protein [Filobasidium floriforme]KAH8082189.1 transcriptional repressor TCF25-domain-containing protein [Filobasidium floriforme]
MSKRLNKRQQREAEELAELQRAQASVRPDLDEEEHDEQPAEPRLDEQKEEDDEAESEVEEEQPTRKSGGKVLNPFAALNAGEDEEDEEEELDEDEPNEAEKEEQVEQPTVTKSSKKKKKKKSKSAPAPDNDDLGEEVGNTETPPPHHTQSTTTATATGTPGSTSGSGKSKKKNKKKAGSVEGGLDEIDLALKSLGLDPKDKATTQGETSARKRPVNEESVKRKNLLAVDTKSLDSEAELKRFFGAKVVASAQQGQSTKQSRQQKLFQNYISKIRTVLVPHPKSTWPVQSGFGGLSMRQLDLEEVLELLKRRELDGSAKGSGSGTALGKLEGERWFTFEHDAGWRQVHTQFLGAVRSHDPNQLQALLSVYNWQIDTLLQMSAIYNQQGDIGAAADHCERALFAYDRCLAPGFAMNGTCRLDFDRVENRPMFLALHRLVSHLARRGLWQTAFSYAKALLSLDPENDPHGAFLWLDFLAIKSGNLDWIQEIGSAFDVEHLPGINLNRALALRMQEKGDDHKASDALLREAIVSFPQVVAILADKAGFNISGSARSHPHFQMRVGYSGDWETPMHLLAHIYAARNNPLWKDSSIGNWFSQQLDFVVKDIESGKHTLSKSRIPASWARETGGMPLWLVRHAFLSESYMGWIPPPIAAKLGHAFDPLPPTTSITQYDNAYYAGVRASPRTSAADPNLDNYLDRLMDLFQARLPGADIRHTRRVLRERLTDLIHSEAFQMAGAESDLRQTLLQETILQVMIELGEDMSEEEGEWADQDDEEVEEGQGQGVMPGAFPQ